MTRKLRSSPTPWLVAIAGVGTAVFIRGSAQTPAATQATISTNAPSATPEAVPEVPPSTTENWFDRLSRISPEHWLSYDVGHILIKPHLSTQFMVTDNYNYRSSSLAQSDEIISISPGVKFQYGASDYNRFAFDYTFDDVVFIEHSQFATTQHHLDFSDDVKVSRFEIAGTDKIAFLSSFVGAGNIQRTLLIDRRTWNDDYTITYDATDKVKPYFRGVHQDTQYAPSAPLYGGDNLTGNLGATYQATAHIGIFGEGSYGQSSVFTQYPGFLNDAPHSVVYGGHIGARGDFTSNLTGLVSVGFDQRVFAPQVQAATVSSPTAQVSLNYQATDKLSVQALYDRHTDVSANFGRQSTISQSLTLSASQFVGPTGKWIVQANVSYSPTDFSDLYSRYVIDTTGGFVYANINSARTDSRYQAGVSLIYQPQLWIRVSVGYAYDDYSIKFKDPLFTVVNPQYAQLSYQANTIYLQFQIGF